MQRQREMQEEAAERGRRRIWGEGQKGGST
jgi:hypothetical protein